MKLHGIFGFFGCLGLLGGFLAPIQVAPVCYALGIVCMFIAIILITVQRYEETYLERLIRERRKF